MSRYITVHSQENAGQESLVAVEHVQFVYQGTHSGRPMVRLVFAGGFLNVLESYEEIMELLTGEPEELDMTRQSLVPVTSEGSSEATSEAQVDPEEAKRRKLSEAAKKRWAKRKQQQRKEAAKADVPQVTHSEEDLPGVRDLTDTEANRPPQPKPFQKEEEK